jgi:hypothetical protein
MLYYANRDKTKIVPEGDPEAQYVVNSGSPGEFGELLQGHLNAPAAEAEPEAPETEAPAAAEKPPTKAPEAPPGGSRGGRR